MLTEWGKGWGDKSRNWVHVNRKDTLKKGRKVEAGRREEKYKIKGRIKRSRELK